MKKANRSRKSVSRRSTMRPEYDFSEGVRGKYAKRFSAGTTLVLLDPDVAIEFPSAAAVKKALREVLKSRSKRRTA